MRDLAPGMVVAGYRIDALVGRGGMGVVYRAFQPGLERVVALKVIAPQLLDDEDVRRRFLAEARAAASVDHPHVIPVYDAGEDDGVAYLAMRYVDGDDLRSMVRRRGPLDPAEAAEFVAQAGAALDAIHRAGFVHRDIKPANLLVDPEGHVYVTDFGLAKAALTHGTATGQWVGTLDYVAPEQIRGGRIDARADVYALGGVLHYALTGSVPFDREGDEAKLWAQLSAPPPVPSGVRRGINREFDAAVARAMAKAPEERFPSAGDLGRAARAAALGRTPSESEQMVARGAAAPDAARTEPGLAGEAETRTAARPAPPRRGRVPFVVAGAVAVLGVAVVLALSLRDEPAQRTATTPTASPTASATPAVAHVAKTIPNVGDRPSGLVLAGGDLWVISARSEFLTRVEAATGRERGDHPKIGRDAAAIVADGDRVWVSVGSVPELLELDLSGAIRRHIPLPAAARRLAVDRSGIWAGIGSATGDPGLLLRFDREGKEQQRLSVREGIGGLLAADGVLWVVKRDTRKLARLAPGASQLVDWATLPADVGTMRYGDGELWVTLEGEDSVARIDSDGRRMVTGAAGRSPATALLADGHVYVTSRNDNTVVVLDPKTLKPTMEPIGVGFNPLAMVADEHAVWVATLGDNTLTRIDYR